MYDFGKQVKEKARQQKQIDKALKRRMAKQQKANIKTHTPNAGSDIAEPIFAEDIVESTDLPICPSIMSFNKKAS